MSVPRRIVQRYAGHPFRLFVFTLKSAALYHLVTTHLYAVEGTWGASMLPTMAVMGDWVLISKLHRRGRDIKVGDIVAFASVTVPGEKVIKRVVGMEGDYVLRDTPEQDSDKTKVMIQVPEGHCWVIGDNIPWSKDSRHFGPLPLAMIRGKVLAKVLPFSERQWFEDGLREID